MDEGKVFCAQCLFLLGVDHVRLKALLGDDGGNESRQITAATNAMAIQMAAS